MKNEAQIKIEARAMLRFFPQLPLDYSHVVISKAVTAPTYGDRVVSCTTSKVTRI